MACGRAGMLVTRATAVTGGPTAGAVRVKLTPLPGAADANERRGPGGQALRANRIAALIAYFVFARFDFAERGVNLREMRACLLGERRDVLPLESDRGALWIMLVVAARRAFARAGDDRGELPLELCDPVQRVVAFGGQPRLRGTRVSHLDRLSFKMTIPSAGC